MKVPRTTYTDRKGCRSTTASRRDRSTAEPRLASGCRRARDPAVRTVSDSLRRLDHPKVHRVHAGVERREHLSPPESGARSPVCRRAHARRRTTGGLVPCAVAARSAPADGGPQPLATMSECSSFRVNRALCNRPSALSATGAGASNGRANTNAANGSAAARQAHPAASCAPRRYSSCSRPPRVRRPSSR
jgi:hypothetical protein